MIKYFVHCTPVKSHRISHCVTLLNFLVWKFCGNCAFPQNFYTRKLGEIEVFYAISISHIYIQFVIN